MKEVSEEIKAKLIKELFEGHKDFLTGKPEPIPFSIKESESLYHFYFEHTYNLGNINDGKKYYTSCSMPKIKREKEGSNGIN